MQFGETFHMGFVNDGVVPGNLMMAGLSFPVETGINHDALRHERSAVAVVKGGIVAGFHFVSVDRGIPFQFAHVGASVRIKEQFVGIETMSGFGLVGTVDAVSVNCVGADFLKISVPDLIGIFRKFDAIELAVAGLVEDTDFDFGGVGGEDREISALAVPGPATGIRLPFL